MAFKLFTRLMILAVILTLICYSALYLNPDYKKEYVAGIVSKLHKLKDVDVNKIVFIGGSNASFGIDTELMETELGIPVVNMALHGGIPVKYLVEQVKPYVKKGDILVFSKEYEGFRDSDWNTLNGIEISKVATYDIFQMRILFTDRKMFETTISNVFKTIKKYIDLYPIQGRKGLKSVYDARAFRRDNLLPDMIDGKYKLEIKNHELKLLDGNSKILEGLKEYKNYFESKEVKFLLTPPVVIKGYFDENKILPFWHFFSEKTGIPMLNNTKKYTLDKKYFFNSHYHTNYQGRKIRTELLIEDIISSGLMSKESQRTHNNVMVGNAFKFNKANLDSFTTPYNFEILERDGNHIKLKQTGSLNHNYFRIRFNDKDYTGYNFFLQLECDTTVIENIKFRGAGQLAEFDTILNLGNNNYKLWKKLQKVLYKNSNSYMGIAFPENHELKAKEFIIKDVGVFENFGMNDIFVDKYELGNNDRGSLFFEVLSDRNFFDLSEIINWSNQMKHTKLESNRLYKVYVKKTNVRFENFYKGTTVFETTQKIVFKKSNDFVIRIFD